MTPENIVYYLKNACVQLLEREGTEGYMSFRTTQREAVQAYLNFLQKNDTSPKDKLSGFFEIPTGIGKTALFASLLVCARRLAQERGEDFKVGIIAPTIPLLNQTREELIEFFPECENDIGIFGGTKRQLDKPITIITYDSWTNLVDRGVLSSENFTLLISDEAHRGTSVERERRLINTFSDAARLAFTATAHFDPDRTVYTTHRNRIYEKPIEEAVRSDELAAYIEIQLSVIRINFEAESDFTRQLAKQNAFNQFAKQVLLTGKDQVTGNRLTDNQGGIFVYNTTHADNLEVMLNQDAELAEIARERGCKKFSVSIHTNGMSAGEQLRREKDYKRGKYLFVIGDEKFKEGFNHKPMKTVIDTPHGSLVDKAQILGRGARKWFNPAKGRYEGLTFIDTLMYFGDKDPIKNERNRKIAVMHTITAADVLDGKTSVYGPRITAPTIKSPSGKPGPTTLPPIDKPSGEVTFFVTGEDIRQLLAEREELNKKELVIDWASPENRKDWDELRQRKGNPGEARIYKYYSTLPEYLKNREDDEPVFTSIQSVAKYLYRDRTVMPQQVLSLLTTTLELMDDAVDWSQEDNRSKFSSLYAKKGNVGATSLFKNYQALPENKKINGLGEPLFDSIQAIQRILSGLSKSVTLPQLQTLTGLLEAFPDSLDWRNEENRKDFEKLWAGRGNPGGETLFKLYQQLPADKQNGENGAPLFTSVGALQDYLYCNTNWITVKQLDTLKKLVASMPATLEWSNPKVRKEFLALRRQKGMPGEDELFKKISLLPHEITHTAEGKPIFPAIHNIGPIVWAKSETVLEREVTLLMKVMEKMEDAIDWSNPKNRHAFEEQKARTGNPAGFVLYNAYRRLPAEEQLDAEGKAIFTGRKVIDRIIYNKTETISQSQLATLTKLLELVKPAANDKLSIKNKRPQRQYRAGDANTGPRQP